MPMKKIKQLFVAALAVIAALVVVYRVVNQPPADDMPIEARVLAILEEGGCMSCHSAEPDVPFYATLPVAGDVVMQDIENGYRAYDIAPLMEALRSGGEMQPIDVAKVEGVALNGTMPMAKYYLVHWGSQMTSAKRDIIVEWARAYRATHYADGLAGERAGEPIRPIAAASANLDERKVALGFDLFHDPRLSRDNTVSCSSCHDLATGGVDNHQFSDGIEGRMGGVNAPTVYNAVYNFVQFWDGRARTLAEQAAGPPLNPVEMGYESFDEIIAKLSKDRKLVRRFKEIYGEGITQANITDAIEEFERTLVTPDSQFDKWLRGDDAALTAAELNGYNLFKANNCAMCHVGANLGGESYELMGLRRHYFADRGTELTVEDNGRYKETQEERDRHRFKVPGLRNIALTWPYYHDGTRLTMEEAVRDMARYQSDVELSDADVADIVAFLHTLTGEYQGKKLETKNEYGKVYTHDDH